MHCTEKKKKRSFHEAFLPQHTNANQPKYEVNGNVCFDLLQYDDLDDLDFIGGDSVKLYCRDEEGAITGYVSSLEGSHGEWQGKAQGKLDEHPHKTARPRGLMITGVFTL